MKIDAPIDGSNVMRLTTRAVKIGTVWCHPLNLRFPTVYRVVQSITRDQFNAHGLHDQEPFANENCYELENSARRYLGTIERIAISTLDPSIDRVSLVIRYHPSEESALGYLVGLEDFGAYSTDHWISSTEEGVFTLISRPTKPSWPGPLIIYCADNVPADNCLGEECWAVAMTRDGILIEEFADFDDS